MEKSKANLLKGIITLMVCLVVLIMIPGYALGDDAKLETQIVHTNTGDYIIYVEGLVNQKFEFAISDKLDATDEELHYISVKDEDENNVAIISEEKYKEIKDNEKTYLYIKTEDAGEVSKVEINLENVFEQDMMEEVEKTTKRIETEIVTDIVKQNEEVDGVKVTVTVGGLKITDKSEAKFYYASTKLPEAKYTELNELARKIEADYNKMDMYTKIKTAREFYNLYTELSTKQNWIEVKDMSIMQPEDAQKGEQYVVYLKKVDNENNETIDLKIMTSYREDEEEKIPGRTETKVVQETAKLPITGDSIVLFVILAVIILVAIIVFVRMKKLQNKEAKK